MVNNGIWNMLVASGAFALPFLVKIMNQGQAYTDDSPGFFPGMDLVRHASPMVAALLKMALAICIPLVLRFGTQDLKTAVTVNCAQFALFFMDFWFRLARWIDSIIPGALYGANSPHSNVNPVMGLNNGVGDLLLNFVMGAMLLELLMFRVVALSWTRERVRLSVR